MYFHIVLLFTGMFNCIRQLYEVILFIPNSYIPIWIVANMFSCPLFLIKFMTQLYNLQLMLFHSNTRYLHSHTWSITSTFSSRLELCSKWFFSIFMFSSKLKFLVLFSKFTFYHINSYWYYTVINYFLNCIHLLLLLTLLEYCSI